MTRTLVLGGARSGKRAYAGRLAVRLAVRLTVRLAVRLAVGSNKEVIYIDTARARAGDGEMAMAASTCGGRMPR